MNRRRLPLWRSALKPLVFAACSVPLIMLAGRAFELFGSGLGANPIEAMMDHLGQWGLRFLLLTLGITPLAVTVRKPWLMKIRRMIGLFAFTYLSLHFLTWLVLDKWLEPAAIVEDIAERPFITVGFAALLLLLPLAVTSTNGWMRRLGRRWHSLHRLVYPATVLACIHFWWQVKADLTEPLIYSAILAALLGWRLWRAKKFRGLFSSLRVPAQPTK